MGKISGRDGGNGLRKIALIFAILCFAFPVMATNYYMAPLGNDANDGLMSSLGRAWATLQHAEGVLVAGDTLFVEGGTYSSAQQWYNSSSSAGGTTLRPIVIKAYGDAIANFTMSGTTDMGNSFFAWIWYCTKDHIVIDGESHLHPSKTRYFVFTGSCYRMFWTEPNIGRRISGIVVRGCEFDGRLSDTHGSTMVAIADCDSFVIDNCYIHHAWHATGSPGGDGTDGYEETGDNVTIRSCSYGKITNNTLNFGNHFLMMITPRWQDGEYTTCKYITISGNTFDNGWGGGVGLTQGSSYCLVENNYFTNCGCTCRNSYSKPSLELAGSYNTVRRNVIYNPCSQGLRVEAQYDCGTCPIDNRNYIYNNTIFNCE